MVDFQNLIKQQVIQYSIFPPNIFEYVVYASHRTPFTENYMDSMFVISLDTQANQNW